MFVLFQETRSLCCKHKQPVDSQMLLSVSILYRSEIQKLVDWISRVVLTLIHTHTHTHSEEESLPPRCICKQWLFIITFLLFFGLAYESHLPLFPSLFIFSDRFEPDLINGARPHFLTRHFLLSHGAFLATVHFILHRPNRSGEGERLTSFCLLVRSPSLRFESTDAHETKPINCPLRGSFSKTTNNLIETWCCSRWNLISG